MDANFASLQAALNHDQSLAAAYLAFSRFTAKVKCGHSYPNFFNQPTSVVDALFVGQNRVPFYFRWIGQQMIVTRNFSANENLRRGSEILSINGVPVATIQEQLLHLARADGSNDAKRISAMQVIGDSKYEAFDIYFPLLYPPVSTVLNLSVRPPGATIPVAVQVTALTFEQRAKAAQANVDTSKGPDTPDWTLKYLSPNLAYLRMPSWAMYNSKWDWKAWLNKTFDELAARKPQALVIDLRGNEGGDDVGNVILSRLVSQDLHLSQYERRVRYRKAPAELLPYLDTWDKSFTDWGDAAVGPVNGFYRLTRFDDDKDGDVIHPVPPPYTGRMFILVDASNSSATFQFENNVQRNHLGTLVGQPTGGNLRGINGGAFFFLRLPKSQIEVDVPLIGTFPASPQPDAGLQPDIHVQPSIQDIANGVDSELAAVQKAMAKEAH